MTRRTQLVLVVEDDPEIRDLAIYALEELPYRVVGAEDGIQALRLLQQRRHPVDLLFTDIRMPGGIDGFQLALKAINLRPELKVLYATASPDVALKRPDVPSNQLLLKPYRLSELRQRVLELLNGPASFHETNFHTQK
jgi:CheY-like chemotaxis protein